MQKVYHGSKEYLLVRFSPRSFQARGGFRKTVVREHGVGVVAGIGGKHEVLWGHTGRTPHLG